jgi:peptidoglycan/LPS O-acetylase OafA/YrhL
LKTEALATPAEFGGMPNTVPRRPTIPALTGIRFVAAMMVFFSHYPVPGAHGPLRQVMRAGYSGVTIFFVLSGFVITYNYLERFEHDQTWAGLVDFLVARFARIYPLYALLTLMIWLIAPASGGGLWLFLLALQTWHPNINIAFGLVAPSWSIGVEIFLYLMFPLLIPLLSRLGILISRRRLMAATGVVAIAMICVAIYFTASGRNAFPISDPMSAHRWIYRTPLTRLGDFLLGIFGAVYCIRFAQRDARFDRLWRLAAPSAILIILALMAMRANYLSTFSFDVTYALPTYFLLIALTLARYTWLGGILGSASLVLLGEASYAIYLIHTIVAPWHIALSKALPSEIIAYMVFTMLVIASSIGIHIAIERPARRFIRDAFAWLVRGRATQPG